jgi:hypothetical protein
MRFFQDQNKSLKVGTEEEAKDCKQKHLATSKRSVKMFTVSS